MFIFCVTLCLGIVSIRILVVIFKLSYDLWPLHYFIDTSEYVPVFLMIIIFIPLVILLKKYHREEFYQNIITILFFFIFEVSMVTIFRFEDFLTKGGAEYEHFEILKRMSVQLGLYPLQQAFCAVYLKKTRDPLDGLSKLDFIYLVSITQRQNPQFIDNFKESKEWDQLDQYQ